MTSILNVDEIAAKNGTDPVALTKQAGVKHFVIYDNSDASRAIQKSLNCSSLSDLATGQTSVSYTNNFSDIYYTHGGVTAWGGGDITAAVLQSSATSKNDITTSAIELSTKYAQSSSSGLYDYDYASNSSLGDLA